MHKNEYMEDELGYFEESNKRFREKLSEFGLNEEQIYYIVHNTNLADHYFDLELEEKLNALYLAGFDMAEIYKGQYFLYEKTRRILLKCEMAIVEDIPVDAKFLQNVKCREAIANFRARETGLLPKDCNIFSDAKKAAYRLGMSKTNYIEKFYSVKSFRRLHHKFKEECSEFYEIFCSFPSYQGLIEEKASSPMPRAQNSSNKPQAKPSTKIVQPTYDNVCYSTDKTHKENLREKN